MADMTDPITYAHPTGDPPPTAPDILVVGEKFHELPWFFTWGLTLFSSNHSAGFISDPLYNYTAYGDNLLAPQADNAIHELKVNISRPLTPKEKEIIEKFMGEIAAADTAIASLPWNAVIIMPNGSTVTAGELKQIWANADFVINDLGHKYNAGTPQENTRGEADYNNGNPVISFNINTVQSYIEDVSASGRGGFWVIFHELGHMTSESRSNYSSIFNDADGYTEQDRQAHERYANDFAKVMADHSVGASPSLSHISAENPYTLGLGSIYTPGEVTPALLIPSWKFDSVEGEGLIPIN